MKKTLKLFGLVALSAFVFSCTKETALDIEKENITPADEQQAETPDTPVIPATDGGLLTSFGVTFEGQQDADTKVSINLGNGETAIEDGDEVLVYVSETNKAVYAYNKAESKFELSEGAPVALDAPASVFYPAGEFNNETGVFTMPAAVTGLEDLGDKAPMAGQIEEVSGAYKVELKNLASVLKVGVTGATTNTLTSVTLAATGKSVAEGAAYTVDFSGERPVLATETADAASSMKVSVGGADLSGEARTFYFLVPAGLSLGDVTVTATLGENHNGGDNTFSISRANFTPEAKKIIGMSFYAGLFSGGTGISDDPYIIANARDFKYISKYCAEGYGNKEAALFLGATYKQTAAIDFNKADLSNYMIASASAAFSGTYDGDNKTLSNYSITHTPTQGDKDGAALFQNVEDGVLKNISISGATVTGGKFSAGLVGYAKACTITGCSIENSTISSGVNYGGGGLIGGLYAEAADSETSTVTSCSANDITFTKTGSGQHFGGLICYINGVVNVSGCSIAGTITVNGTPNYFGGIVSQINDEETRITDCENHSTISGVGNYAGGIVGQKTIGAIERCTNDGSISGAQYVGGIVGINAAGAILGCTNTGKGTITSSGNAGGIAGQVTQGTIQTCKNSGNVNASGNNIGGIAGYQSGGSEILECWSNAQITGKYQTGGIVGFLDDYGAVVRCTAKGDVSGTQCVGGIVGHAYASYDQKARGILVMECLSKANVTASTGTDSNSGGVIGRLHSNRISGGSIQWANVFQCVGWSATIKNTNTATCTRFGAFVGFVNTQYSSGASTQARCQVRNSYTTVATDHMIWLAGTPSSTGGFVGQLQRGRFHGCYYQLDNNTQSATASKNLVVLENFTKVDNDFATYLMSNLETTADNNYTGNGKSYAASAWTMTGKNGESLEYPLPSALVALGTEYYD